MAATMVVAIRWVLDFEVMALSWHASGQRMTRLPARRFVADGASRRSGVRLATRRFGRVRSPGDRGGLSGAGAPLPFRAALGARPGRGRLVLRAGVREPQQPARLPARSRGRE